MYIERNGIKIELTRAEVEQAFRERDLEYHIEDAHQHLKEFFGIGEDEEAEVGKAWFKRTLGMSYDEATDKASERYILKDMAQDFLDNYKDSEVEDNVAWNSLIHSMIEEHKNAA